MSLERALKRIKEAKEKNSKTLNLSLYNLKELPKELFELKQLSKLDISHNQISDISLLGKLSQLQSLNLSYNQISDISTIHELKQLSVLNLNNNQVTDISPLEYLFEKKLLANNTGIFLPQGIYFSGNPIIVPPKEILQRGHKSTLNYFKEIKKQGVDYLYEAKMLIIGEGGAGKTSLATKLQHPEKALPKEDDTTKGIDIQKMTFPCREDKEFTINLWDFGGQEIYHATHQFFLTKRSLYLLVDDTRKDDKTVNDATFKYWLQTVELFGDGSPLLIIQNEKGDRSKDIDLAGMQGRFDFIKGKHATNLLSGRGLEQVKRAIEYHIQELPHIGEPLPKQWIKIREEIIRVSAYEAYITLHQYYEICKQFEIPEKERALSLSQYLHDLGTFLHFQNNSLLKKSIILQNKWATDAVYKVLDHEGIKAKNGRFAKREVAGIWSDSTYAEMHDDLLELMLEFELCYALDDKKERFLIPQLLPASKPTAFTWDNLDNIQLKYDYDFMPKGLLSRFIVRTNRYIKDLDKAWKSGVVLEKENTWALVQETFASNEISIRVRGTHQKSLMTTIKDALDALNDTYEGIRVHKKIPCNCTTCSSLDTPHFYDYNNILERIRDQKKTIECNKKPYEDVSVFSLIDNLFSDYKILSRKAAISYESYSENRDRITPKEQIKNLLRQNKTQDAFNLINQKLQKINNNSIIKNIILLESQFNMNERKIGVKIISEDIYSREHARINNVILSILDDIFKDR